MTTDKKVRVGLIGYGFAGRTFHAPPISCVPNMELTVFGTSRADEVHKNFPNALVIPPAEVPTHPDVDLVVIATPNDSHAPLATAALRAGKHVVIDKPFTVTLDEARTLIAIAKEEDRILAAFHNRRWESEVRATKAIIESGELGDIKHYECHLDRFRPNVRKRWREEAGPGAGLWFDLGPHLIDQCVYLFGIPDSVNGNFGILRDGATTDDWAHVQLNYKTMRVILQATLLAAGGSPRTMLHGTKGSWIKTGGDVQEAQLISGMMPTNPAFGIDPSPGILIKANTSGVQLGGIAPESETIETPAPVGNQMGYYIGIRDAILDGAPLPVPTKDALANMAILTASFDSYAQGRTLPIPLTDEERRLWP
jgi:predicted dehydrogenase